ncbi:MAG TPA: hypothetical protein PLX23_04810 [Candidatus Hydrogenedens sp.]|nr:hypothetical protein [Candidatus Hydrogenedens sp.]
MNKKYCFSAIIVICCLLFYKVLLFAEELESGSDTKQTRALLLITEPQSEWALAANDIETVLNKSYNVSKHDIDTFLLNNQALDAMDLLVVMPGFSLPIVTVSSITNFIEKGGDLIAFGAPLWKNELIWDGKHCYKPIDYIKSYYTELVPTRQLFDEINTNNWNWASSNRQSSSRLEYEKVKDIIPDKELSGVHVSIQDLKSWDVFISPPIQNPFPEQHQETVFFAKGGSLTEYLTIEWREQDSSRWIASVPLGTDWKLYALTPDKFKLWEGPPSRTGTSFNPQNAVQCCIGLAMTHSPIRAGQHEFWMAGFGTAPVKEGYQLLMQTIETPKLELFSPDYKFYSSNDIHYISTESELGLERYPLIVPADLLLMHPRPRGGGFLKQRSWRWIPLVHAWGTGEEWRGTAAATMIYNNESYANSVQTCFAIQNAAWYQDERFLKYFSKLVHRIQTGIFLVDGGNNFYTTFPEQKLTLGATVCSTTKKNLLNMSVQILLKNWQNNILWKEEFPIQVEPLKTNQVQKEIDFPEGASDNLLVECYLKVGDEVIDFVSHGLNRWNPKDKKEYITIENGDFIYQGKRWCPHGVNYMPSSGIGTENIRYFEYWLSAESYDPWIIQRDLQHVADMGLNSISVFFYHNNIKEQNLLDLLYRADLLGLKVNLSLRPGTPFDFEWDKIKEMIECYRLPEHDEVFAYDLAWEPLFSGHEGRKRYDAEWTKWVIERYGSVENAEKDWGYPIPKDEQGNITNPKDETLTNDGEWRVMACAYRRFLDTLLYKYYSQARTLVRSIDPYHAVSFRMTETSDPTYNSANPLPYDWYYLALAVDILEPEAYGRVGDWEKIKPGWFQVEYGRFCNPDLPLFWAEMGYSVYRKKVDEYQSALEFQAKYFEDFYRLLLYSGSDGIYFWWYPGGYRVNEKSDFGIINPDGTYRFATAVIKQHANIFNEQEFKPYDCEIEIDRDKTSMGVVGIYQTVQEEFWRLIDEGKKPKLVSAGSNTNSMNCPLIAVGNVPYNGSNPLKYLDAYFDRIVWLKGSEKVDIHEQDTIQLPKGTEALEIKVICTNLGEAEWVVGNEQNPGEGEVFLHILANNEQRVTLKNPLKRGQQTEFQFKLPIQGVQTMEMTMESFHRAYFGPKFTFTIKLQD